ncbi:MAG: S1 RNA-binding domain-containing protein [Candidatus Woesearchaeota archaeon]|nr:S1 RNA-binding domain-containing protein [Candidatus Woesearchaeota archaeon]
MLYRKEGLPEEGQIVICTVTKIQFHSVFVRLDEYDKEGMIHISEIAAGRIRNMRDYVREDKLVVCKVLRVEREKESIDLSLRRVTEKEKREKTEWMKKEQLSEKIIENIAFLAKSDYRQMYDNVTSAVFRKYEDLSSCFEKIAAGEESLEKLGVEKKTAEAITKLIIQRIKHEFVSIKGELKLISYEPDGVEIVKEAIGTGLGINKNPKITIDIKYAGAGSYSVKVTATDYKSAEKALDNMVSEITDFMKEKDSEAEFKREE